MDTSEAYKRLSDKASPLKPDYEMPRKRQANIYAIAETRRLTVCELKDRIPSISGAEIGRLVGITRERVRQILNKAGKPTKALRIKRACPQCGKPVPKGNMKFCCKECRLNSTLIPVPCDYCKGINWYSKKHVEYLQARGRQKRFFCSKQCQGKWLAKCYGFHRKEVKDDSPKLE